MYLTRAGAAFAAWAAVFRAGHGTRSVADALVETFDHVDSPTPGEDDRADWQACVDEYAPTAGYETLIAAACARFDLVAPFCRKTARIETEPIAAVEGRRSE